MLPTDWIEHRRSDRELVGWIVPRGDGFCTVDLLGRFRHEEPVDWFEAETSLDELGIGYLADSYVLTRPNGQEIRVRIAEVSTDEIVVVDDESGAAAVVGTNPERFTLPFPAPDTLISRSEMGARDSFS